MLWCCFAKKIGMKMGFVSLFEGILIESILPSNSLSIDTPRGTIFSTLNFDGTEVSSMTSEKVMQLSTNSYIGIWDDELIHAELLRMQYNPVIPAHMSVSYSWAYVWRIKTKKKLTSVVLGCFLIPSRSIIDTDVQTGEGLYSVCTFFEEDSLYMGTEDENFLYQRAEASKNLPSRYMEEELLDYNAQALISSREHSLHIHCPPPKSGELIQLQFVVAGGRDSTSNWFAVEADPRDLLMQAGCK